MTEKKKITSLTDEQVAALSTVRDEWLAFGLSTEPADRPEAERGVREAYQAAGLEEPKLMVWLDSPMAGAIGAWVLAGLELADVERWLRRPPPVQRMPLLADSEMSRLRHRVIRSVVRRVTNHVRLQMERPVAQDTEDVVVESIISKFASRIEADPAGAWSDIRAQMYRCGYGQHDASWLSFYDYFGRYCDLAEEVSKLSGVIRIGRSAGWWWPFDDAAILTERPIFTYRDAQSRLHREDGPSLQYPDGWSIWAWHGVRVEPWVIDGSATADKILKERNAEVRRCAIEAYGWPRFIADAGLEQLAGPVPDPGNPGQSLTLYSVPEQIYEEAVNVLIATNGTVERDGTRRTFGLTVPADITDPVAAAAWGYNLEPEDYAQMARRS